MDTKIIDVLALDEKAHKINLLIMDDLLWHDSKEHIDQMQEKILKYINYVEKGEFTSSYPSYEGYEFVIRIIFSYPPAEDVLLYIQEAQAVLADVGFCLDYLNNEDLEEEK